MVVFKLIIFFRLWMPYAKVTEVTCGLYPLIGGQGAITRDVGEGFPIHRRGCEQPVIFHALLLH